VIRLNETQRLRRLTFRSPKYYLIIPVILFAVFLFYISSRNVTFTVIYSLAITTTIIWDISAPRLFNFRFPPNRVMFLNAVSIYAGLAFYFIVVGIRFLQPVHALMLSITFLPFIRTMVFITFTGRKIALTHFLGISFSLFFSLYVSIFAGKYDLFIAPIVLSSLVYSLSSHLFVKFSLSKFMKEFSTDPIKLINEMVNSVTSDISYNLAIKKFFEDMYTTLAPREVSVVRFEGGDDRFEMVFPYVHPGPIGDIGSSNITRKLQIRNPGKNLLVFHTTTTHDDNCASDSEIDKISLALKEKGSKFDFCYEPFFGRYLTFLPLGNGGIFFLSPDDPRFDDVKISEGRRIVRMARSAGLRWSVVVDQHNNNMDEPKELDDVSYLMEEVNAAVRTRKTKSPLFVHEEHIDLTAEDVGPGGIHFVSLKMGEKNVAVILVDGNNMEFELRKKIEDRIKGYDKVLVCTTDNHVVNVNGLNVNPVGHSSEHQTIVDAIGNLSMKTYKHNEASMEYARKDVRVRIAGENHYEKFNKIIKSSANRAKILSAMAILLSIGLSLFIFKILA